MAKDFQTKQIRTTQIIASGGIGSGSGGSSIGLLIYSSSDASNLAGGMSHNMTASVGTDVWMFVSGANEGKNKKSGVVLFGGDVVVSGVLYAEKQVIEVEESTTGSLSVSGSLFVSKSFGIGVRDSETLAHFRMAGKTGTPRPLEMLRLEIVDEGVDMDAGQGPAIDFYVGETGGSNYGGTVAVVKEENSDADSDAAMVFHTATDDQVPGVDREKVRITSAGRVGIGTKSPEAILEARGNIISTGFVSASMGLTGSLTRLVDGKSYIEAGSNITVTSASNGAITIAAATGVTPVAGSDTQYQYNNGGAFGGAADLTFNDSTGDTTVGASTGDAKLFFRDTGIYLYSKANGELDIVSDTKLGISGSGNTASAVGILASHSGGGIDIDAGTGGIAIDSTGVISIDGVGSSNITTKGALTVSGSAGLNLKADSGTLDIETRQGAIDVDAGGALTLDGSSIGIGTASDVAIDIDSSTLDIDASGAITIDGTSTFSIDGVGTSNVTAKGALTVSGSSGLNLKSDGGTIDIETRVGSIDIDSAGALTIDSATSIGIGTNADKPIDIDSTTLDIDASGAITIDGTSTFSIDGVGTSNVTTKGALTVSGSTALNLASDSGEIDITTRQGSIDINAGDDVTIDASDNMTLTAADNFNVNTSTADGKVTLYSAHTAGSAFHIDADAAAGSILDIDAGILDIDVTGNTTIDSGGTFSIDGVGTSNVTTKGSLTVSGSTGLNLKADSGTLDIETRQGAIDVDSAGALTLDSATSVGLGTANSGIAVTVGHSTSETTIGDNLTVKGNLGVNGIISGSLGLSGSLTRLVNGKSAFEAGTNITITSASNGPVTISSSGGGRSVAGDTDNGIITWVTSDNTFAVESNLTFDGTDSLIAAAGKIQLRDTGIYLYSKADGELDIISDTKLGISGSGNTAAAVGILASHSAGGIDIDAGTGGIAIDSTGVISIDGADDMNFTITSDGAGEDLTIQQIGANDSSIIITAAGTGTDAVKIDATAGDMLIAPSLTDGKTLKIGKTGAVEVTIAPHGTAGSEKFTVTNTSGNAADAISLNASAGGILINADASKIHLDAEGTGADAIDIDSGGGLDVDVADAISLTTTSADGHIELVSAHTSGVAVHIDADANAGSIVDIDAGVLDIDITGNTTIDGGGTFSVDAVGTSNITTNGALTVSGSTGLTLAVDSGTAQLITSRGGEVDITAAGLLDLNAGANLDIDVTGNTTIDGTGTFSVDAVGTSNVTTKGALTISGSTALNLASDSGEIDLTTRQGNIDVNATAGNIDIDAGGTIDIDAAGGINIGKASDVAFDVDTAALDIDSSGAVNVTTTGAASDITFVTAHTAGVAFFIDANANAGSIVDIDAGILDIDVTGDATIDAGGIFSVDAVGASNITTNGALTVSGSTGLNLKTDSGTLDIETRQGAIDVDSAGALTLDSAASISLGTNSSGVAVGIGHTTSETTVNDNLTVTGDTSISQYLYHIADTDTYLRFTPDTLRLSAGGKVGISLLEGSADRVFIGTTDEGMSGAANRYDQVIVMSGGAGASFDEVSGGDVNFYVSGSVGSRGTATRGSALFGGDVVVSGTFSVNRGQAGAGSVVTITDDGKVGIGTDSPSYKLEVGGNMAVGEYIYHRADTDTFIRFQADSVKVNVGNVDMISITEDGSQDKIVLNEGGADVDFRVESSGEDEAIFLDAGNNALYINKGETAFTTIIGSTNDEAARFGAVGIVFNEDGHASNDFRVESDNKPHALFIDASTDQVLIHSGGAAGSYNEATGADINFYVSGSSGTRGTSTRGTAVFGGDLHISGTVTAGSGLSGGGAVANYTNAANNRVLTSVDSDSINGEANLTFDGTDLGISDKIFHVGDTDTFINFTADEINIQAGGIDFIKIEEDTVNSIIFNEAGAAVSFRVESSGEDEALYVDGTNNALYINKGETAFTTIIGSTHDEALRVGSAGVVLNEDGHATNDFRVESDNNSHMLFVDSGNDRLGIGTATGPSTTLHLKEDAPTFRIQRDDNANNATIEWAGAAGTRANMFHLGGDNDLIISSWNGSAVEESLRFAPITRQILFNSGSSNSPASPNEAAASDVSFYVSGTKDSSNSGIRGAALFGGDLVTSGGMYGKQLEYTYHTYNRSNDDMVFIGWFNNNESPSAIDDVQAVMPMAGRPVRVIVRPQNDLGLTEVGFHKASDGTRNISTTAVETIKNFSAADNTCVIFDFTVTGSAIPTANFAAGDVVGISIKPQGSKSPGDCNVTCIWEYRSHRIVSGSGF